MCPYKNLHTDVHILHYTLFIITKKWKQTKGLSTNEIRKMGIFHLSDIPQWDIAQQQKVMKSS